jgi:phosphoribosyl-ATP pyrophosphohydrolase
LEIVNEAKDVVFFLTVLIRSIDVEPTGDE